MEFLDIMEYFWMLLSFMVGDTTTRIIAFFVFVLWLLLGVHGFKVYKGVASFEMGLVVFVLLGFADWPKLICTIIGIIVMIIAYIYFDKLLGIMTFLSVGFFILFFGVFLSSKISEVALIIIDVIVSLIIAFLVVKFTKPVLIIYTSLAFGMLATNALMVALDSSSDGFESVATVACVVFCFVCQYKKYGFWGGNEQSITTFDYKSAQSFLTNVASTDADGTKSVPTQEFIYCTKCGAKYPVTAKFCGKCGNKLQIIKRATN